MTDSEAEPFVYVSKTDEEIKKLSVDLIENKIFASWMILPEDKRLLTSIFMLLGFLDDKNIKELKDQKIFSFYEYISEAGERGVNGYPSFMSVKFLDEPDTRKVIATAAKMREVLNSVAVEPLPV